MTIQEVVKSGKRFRRKKWVKFYLYVDELTSVIRCIDGTLPHLTVESILANDWVTEDEDKKEGENV